MVVEAEPIAKTVAERVLEVLRDHLIRLDPGFEPGQRLDVRGLAASMGVSVTPVKEALHRLEANGLVVVRPRRGVFVRAITAEEVEELLTIRAGLEVTALRLCGQHLPHATINALEATLAMCEKSLAGGDRQAYHEADVRFHHLIVESAASEPLTNLYKICLNRWQVLDGYCPQLSDAEGNSLAEHRQLLTLALSDDGHQLEQELWSHWERGSVRLLERYRGFLAQTSLSDSSSDGVPRTAVGSA